jgi:hypothetical protein
MGQFSPDLFHGRVDIHRDATVAQLGGPILARIVVVSNRVSVPSGDGAKRAGSLEVALRPALERNGGVWFGWSGKAVPGADVKMHTVPHMRYISFSYSDEITTRDNNKMVRLIHSSGYRQLWGDRFTMVKTGERRIDNNMTGFKLATSVGGVSTGERGDRVLLDDPHNVIKAESDLEREKTVRFVRESMSNRLNVEQSAIVVIMQRLHDTDVAGDILGGADKVGEHRHLLCAGSVALDGALWPAGLFRRVVGEAFGNIVANLATSFGASWTSSFGRLRLGVELLVQLFALADMDSALGGGEFGADQVLVDLNQLGLICVDVVENDAVDHLPVEFLRRLEPVNSGDRVVAAVLLGTHNDGLEQALIGHGLGEGRHVLVAKRPPAVLRDGNVA